MQVQVRNCFVYYVWECCNVEEFCKMYIRSQHVCINSSVKSAWYPFYTVHPFYFTTLQRREEMLGIELRLRNAGKKKFKWKSHRYVSLRFSQRYDVATYRVVYRHWRFGRAFCIYLQDCVRLPWIWSNVSGNVGIELPRSRIFVIQSVVRLLCCVTSLNLRSWESVSKQQQKKKRQASLLNADACQ
jgi:hypothetical protein